MWVTRCNTYSGDYFRKNISLFTNVSYYSQEFDKQIISWYKEIDCPARGKSMESGKRKYSRCNLSQIVSYYLLPYIGETTLTGLLHDYSYSGLCIVTNQLLQEGQEICVKRGLMSHSIIAVVRWCSNMGNSTYKVGVEIKNDSLDGRSCLCYHWIKKRDFSGNYRIGCIRS